MSHARLRRAVHLRSPKKRPPMSAAREALLDDAFGPARVLEDLPAAARRIVCRRAASRSSRRTAIGGLIAHAAAVGRFLPAGAPALLLGPLAVAAQARSLGVGGALIGEVARARCRLRIIAPCCSSATPPIMRASDSSGAYRAARHAGTGRARALSWPRTCVGALAGAQGRVMAAGERAAHASRHALPRAA